MRFFSLLTTLMFLLSSPSPTTAGEPIKKPSREGHRDVFVCTPHDESETVMPEGITGFYEKITVAPSTFPDPLLRYRLNVMSTEKEPGNAAPLYVEALAEFNKVLNRSMEGMYQSEEYRKLDPKKDWQTVQKLKFKRFPLYPHWSQDAYTVVSLEDERELYRNLSEVYKRMEKASRKRYYDWNETFEFKGIATLLPNIQDARALARYLHGKADWEIRSGNYVDAVRTIRVGLTLGEHIRESSPFKVLVTELVGIAITTMFQGQIEHLMTQPDAPNLYPALTQLFIPGDSLLQSMYAERSWTFPRLTGFDIDTIDEAGPEECRNILANLFTTLIEGSGSPSPEWTETEWGRSLVQSVICLAGYPYGKERLLKQGRSENEIDKLSTYKIVTPMILEEIKRVYDLLFVITAFPRGESHTAIVFDDEQIRDSTHPANILLSLLIPATYAAKTAFYRQQQTYDRLKIVEAVRYYAAVHDGNLPESLDDIKEVPVPKIDSITGKPFSYRVEGNKVLLNYMVHAPSRMEITVEQPNR